MNGGQRGVAWPDIDSLLRDGVAAGSPDRDLLERYATSRDRGGDLAFTALVARHGPMVLGVCRRILRDPTEADDAFQATFLVLARKAGAIRAGHSLGPWLHGVSVRVARRFQSVAARRAARSSDEEAGSVADRRPCHTAEIEQRLELEEALDALPGSFRSALWLCYFDGLTHEEAAAKLGCPVGTVRSRLARGRALLRQRLEPLRSEEPARSPRGEAGVVSGTALPVVSLSLIQSTARAAARLAAGHPLAGVVPARVAEVAAGVIRTMARTKFATMVAMIVVGTLAGWGAWAGPSGQGPGAGGTGQREIDQPPSNRLRGDFDRPLPKRIVPSPRKQENKPAAELPADFPAFVVETQPKLGDVDVDPSTTTEIRVTFSKPMTDKSWSWTSGNVYSNPKTTGPIHYLADKRTCVMPVKLEPGKTYVLGINGGNFNNFKDAAGKPSLPYTIGFRTRSGK